MGKLTYNLGRLEHDREMKFLFQQILPGLMRYNWYFQCNFSKIEVFLCTSLKTLEGKILVLVYYLERKELQLFDFRLNEAFVY